jgi:fatty-acyl-CoA synthase
MIRTGGENLASREIEEVLFAHPQWAEAGVFGVPDPRWIEAVMAVVVLRPGQALEVHVIEAHAANTGPGPSDRSAS